jgi:hypothetical protein
MTDDARLRRGSPLLIPLVAVLIVACTRAVDPTPPPVTHIPASDPAPTPAPTVSPGASPVVASPTPETPPVWVADLAGQLRCDGPVAEIGQEVPAQPGPFDPGATPDQALDNIRVPYQSIPKSGFEPTEVVGHWARYRYLVDDEAKVVAVATDRFEGIAEEVGWEVVGIRACDMSEFAADDVPVDGATVWEDRHGTRVRTDIVMSFPGPGHCGWQTTVFLSLRGDQYFRDPFGVLEDRSIGTFRADTKLPAKATDTGFHTRKWRIYTVPAGDAVYVKTSAGKVERWPRAKDLVGCM